MIDFIMPVASGALYLGAWFYLLLGLVKQQQLRAKRTLVIVAVGALVHAATLYIEIVTPNGLQLGLFHVGSLFCWIVTVIVLVSSTRKPLHELFILLLPLSTIALLLSKTFHSDHLVPPGMDAGLVAHILLSILAYSLLAVASLQAIVLAYQDYQLKHKHLRGVVGLLPPLQTMEKLLFELVWSGQIMLTLSIVTGALFIDDLFAQKLAHKTVFSGLSWLIFAVLLFGRHTMGWRGRAAIRWTLGGFAALMLAYFGTKLVLEIILGTSGT